jgi:hypothetical protein
MNIPDFTHMRQRLEKEIESLQDGLTSINQAKAVSLLANGIIASVAVEIAATKALPDNQHEALEHDYIDIEAE